MLNEMLQVFYTVVFENRNQNASLWKSKMDCMTPMLYLQFSNILSTI